MLDKTFAVIIAAVIALTFAAMAETLVQETKGKKYRSTAVTAAWFLGLAALATALAALAIIISIFSVR